MPEGAAEYTSWGENGLDSLLLGLGKFTASSGRLEVENGNADRGLGRTCEQSHDDGDI